LLHAAVRAFVAMGAVVSVSRTGENLVRRRAVARTPESEVSPPVEVQAQGLPNLLHELVHALLAGRLDDDHGFDYSGIPYDLDMTAGRSVLWDELAACALSCAYLRADLEHRDLTGTAPRRSTEIDAIVDAWFVEQVEIQPVFYGMEDDTARFVDRVGALLVEHRREADAFVARAQGLLAAALAEAGAAASLATPGPCESLATIWERTIATTTPPMTTAADRRRLPAAPG